MPMMLAAPFSVALFSACEASLGERNLLHEIHAGSLHAAYSAYIREKTGQPPVEVKPRQTPYISWLMTLDLGADLGTIRENISRFGPTQIKLKVDPDVSRIEAVLDKMASLLAVQEFVFYADCNRSFETLAHFKNAFLDKARAALPDEGRCLRSVEEPVIHPFETSAAEVAALGLPVYMDESSAGISDAVALTRVGYHQVLKLTRPVGVLLAQQQVALQHDMMCCVQDLTFMGNTYFMNMGLYAYTNADIGFEANYIQFVNEAWGDALPPDFAHRTRVVNGRLKAQLPADTVFPSSIQAI